MTKRTLLALCAIALPLTAFALNYEPDIYRYKDRSTFTVAEEAGIGLLTKLSIVEGNPNQRFLPHRTLNRAEFATIAMRLYALIHPATSPNATGTSARTCFPDVAMSDWFGPAVCRAKTLGFVQGNPDGLFHPERTVTYAEALKILSTIYDVSLGSTDPLALEAWYQTYLRAAKREKLDMGLGAGALLSRGQMARLAASFHAWSLGELPLYRLAERGTFFSSRSSSSSSSSSSSKIFCGGIAAFQCPGDLVCVDDPSDSCNPNTGGADCGGMCTAPSASTSSSSSPSSLPEFPARSHLLLLGEISQPIGSAQFFANTEPVLVRGARIRLDKGVDSIDAIYMIDTDGNRLGQLTVDTSDPTEENWRATFTAPYKRIEKGTAQTYGIVVKLKARGQGGLSEELFRMETFNISVEGVWSGNTFDSGTQNFTFPQHQTTQGIITKVTNAGEAEGVLPIGTNQLIGRFTISGESVPQTTIRLSELGFQASKPETVTLSNIQLGAADTPERKTCSINASTITCTGISTELGTLQNGTRTLSLYATVSVSSNAVSPFLQISLSEPGAIGTNGSILWTDGTGDFTWVELDAPVARGTEWR